MSRTRWYGPERPDGPSCRLENPLRPPAFLGSPKDPHSISASPTDPAFIPRPQTSSPHRFRLDRDYELAFRSSAVHSRPPRWRFGTLRPRVQIPPSRLAA